MPIQSLGIFDRVFDWVVDKIFSPIVEWLSKILNSIFEWILNSIVIPLLKPVFDFLWNIVIANIADLFYSFIYTGYCKLLWLLDQLQCGFDLLIGLKDVTYTSAETGQKEQSSLLQYFMNNEIVRNAVISVTFIALALSIIFAIYAVMRSTLDFDFEGKRPVGRVLSSVAKTMIAFLLVPVIAVFGVSLASIVLKSTCQAISGGETSLGGWVLAISAINAGRGNPPAPFTNQSTGQINEPWASLVSGETDYITFGVQVHVSRIDYLLGFASIIFMSIIMIMCLFTFIKRIFDIMIMYITSPYFVSTIVLDDGEKFKRWRESFIARVLIGFGSVIGMRIFLMMVPVIMNDQLKIFDSVAGNITGGYVIRLVFILGGMFAVYKSSTLLTGIINPNVAAEENANNMMMGGMLIANAKKGGMALWSKGKSAFSGISKSSKSGGAKSGASGSNKFSGGYGTSSGKYSLPKLSPEQEKKKHVFVAAFAGATGKHNIIDTSDYAPLYSENKDKNYLKDGASIKDKQNYGETRQKNTLGDKDFDDTLSSASELFDTGTLGHDYHFNDEAFDSLNDLFDENNGGTAAQDIVKPVDPLESTQHASSSASGTSSSSGKSDSAQFTGETGSVNSTSTSAINDPLKNLESKITSSTSAGSESVRSVDNKFTSTVNDPLKISESKITSSTSAGSGSVRSVDSKFTSAENDPLLKPRNNHKNDSNKF